MREKGGSEIVVVTCFRACVGVGGRSVGYFVVQSKEGGG